MYKCYNSFQTQAVSGNVSAAEKHGRRSRKIRLAADMTAWEPDSDGKLYLIAETMELSVQQVSQIVQTLEGRALVQWPHDGNGSAGTYIILDPAGKELLRRQEEGLKEYYGRVVEKFGKRGFYLSAWASDASGVCDERRGTFTGGRT